MTMRRAVQAMVELATGGQVIFHAPVCFGKPPMTYTGAHENDFVTHG
jgi:hypothetical protein